MSTRLIVRHLADVTRFLVRPSIRHLILHVTNLCNMRCQHCFVNFEAKPHDLSFAEIQILAQNVNDLTWLDIGGGEPCLRQDLVDLVQLFRAHEVSIPTNGWFPDRIVPMARALGDSRPGVILTVSLDGPETTHDEMRQRGSFQRAVETIRRLGEIPSIRVKINTVVCARNADQILDFMAWVRDHLSVDYHGLLLLRGDPINAQYQLPPPATLAAIGEGMQALHARSQFGRTGLAAHVQRKYQALKWDAQLRTLAEQTQIIPCLGGQAHLVVYANGDVAPCEILPAVGNVRRTPLPDILGGAAWADAVAGIRRKACHCTHDCNMQDNILFNPMTFPELVGR